MLQKLKKTDNKRGRKIRITFQVECRFQWEQQATTAAAATTTTTTTRRTKWKNPGDGGHFVAFVRRPFCAATGQQSVNQSRNKTKMISPLAVLTNATSIHLENAQQPSTPPPPPPPPSPPSPPPVPLFNCPLVHSQVYTCVSIQSSSIKQQLSSNQVAFLPWIDYNLIRLTLSIHLRRSFSWSK